MARALDQILAELNNVYNPQRDTVNQQLQSLDPQQQAENQGLDAAKNDSFQQITDQANRRGLFYSGIPIKEQQQYTGATYLPAVANLKAKYAQQRFNLQDALNKITQDQYNTAYSIRNGELNADATRAAGGGGGGSASPGFDFGGLYGGSDNGGGTADKFAGVDKQGATNAILSLLKSGNKGLAYNTIQAIKTSAARGNLYDQYKLQLLDAYKNNSGYGSFLNSLSAPAPTSKAPSTVQQIKNQTANSPSLVKQLTNAFSF